MKQNAIHIAVDEFTSPIVEAITSEMPLEDIILLMNKKGIRHLPVIENNKPIGIIGQRDMNILDGLKGRENLKAQDVMIPSPFCVQTGTPLESVALDMSNQKIGSALVINPAGELEGIFTSTDALNALIEVLRGEISE